MKPLYFNIGNIIYKEGDFDNRLYIIMEGEVEVF